MSREETEKLPQVLARIGASHGITDLACKLRVYDDWAPEYDQVKTRRVLDFCGPDCVFYVQSENSTRASRGSWELKRDLGKNLLDVLLSDLLYYRPLRNPL